MPPALKAVVFCSKGKTSDSIIPWQCEKCYDRYVSLVSSKVFPSSKSLQDYHGQLKGVALPFHK